MDIFFTIHHQNLSYDKKVTQVISINRYFFPDDCCRIDRSLLLKESYGSNADYKQNLMDITMNNYCLISYSTGGISRTPLLLGVLCGACGGLISGTGYNFTRLLYCFIIVECKINVCFDSYSVINNWHM